MIDPNEVVNAFKNKFSKMSFVERKKFLEEMGFVPDENPMRIKAYVSKTRQRRKIAYSKILNAKLTRRNFSSKPTIIINGNKPAKQKVN